MRYRKLDVFGDYSFGKGKQDLTFGIDAVAQAVQTRLNLLKGEWWEDTEDGIPLFEKVLGAPGSQDNIFIIDGILKSRILSTPGVLEIAKFESDFNNSTREYRFHCTLNTSYGSLELNESL